MNIHS
jgi:hypothetical protein